MINIAKSVFALVFSLCSMITCAQSGVLLNSPEAIPGYVLALSGSSGGTYLMNNCGEIVHRWSQVTAADFHPKLLPNGHLIYNRLNVIYELDWDGTVLKEIPCPDPDLEFVYEVIKKPNGNYLTVARRDFSTQNFTEIGFDTDNFFNFTIIDEIVEIDSITEQIVWQWNIGDHVIQERDSTAPNYGVVAEHPELLDLDAISDFDWDFTESFMINSFDYNPTLNQVAVSVRKMSEIAFIDQSTTTAEASGHTGGDYGKGGDIIFRWGNPQNYGHGTMDNRHLYYQHNPRWITEGPDIGKMTAFSNGLNRPGTDYFDGYSTVPIFDPTMDADGRYILDTSFGYGPNLPEKVYSGDLVGSEFYSGYLSGAHPFPNRNVYITVGIKGRLIELNEAGEIVWEFVYPGNFGPYRTEKYSLDYPAFDNRDLTPSGDFPGSVNSYNCELISGTTKPSEVIEQYKILTIENGYFHVQSKHSSDFDCQVFNMQGQLVLHTKNEKYMADIHLEDQAAGIYFLKILNLKGKTWSTFKVSKL